MPHQAKKARAKQARYLRAAGAAKPGVLTTLISAALPALIAGPTPHATSAPAPVTHVPAVGNEPTSPEADSAWAASDAQPPVPFEVKPSSIPGAGMGLYLLRDVKKGDVVAHYSGLRGI